jgi:hypothetical protein
MDDDVDASGLDCFTSSIRGKDVYLSFSDDATRYTDNADLFAIFIFMMNDDNNHRGAFFFFYRYSIMFATTSTGHSTTSTGFIIRLTYLTLLIGFKRKTRIGIMQRYVVQSKKD